MATEVRRAVTIARPRAEVYRYWRQIENLPRFMENLKSVTETSPGHSHWVAKGPAGTDVEWNAEITEDREGELIAWTSEPGSEVKTTGEVRFVDAPADRGTEVHVVMTYDPPAGAAGQAIAKIFGKDPAAQVREDLRRFKRLLETGEIATTDGQPAGASALRTDKSRTDTTESKDRAEKAKAAKHW